MADSLLFSPITLRDTTFKNRAWVAPMCQYSATDGVPGDWHLVHLGAFAKGGSGLVMAEATSVSPEGRITLADTGLWNDDQRDAFARINRFITDNGSVPGIQLAHAGRKASTEIPWLSRDPLAVEDGGWQPIAPSAITHENLTPPHAMSIADIQRVVNEFRTAATRARDAGFQVVEIHAAHGYLIHQFLSPLTNTRSDGYGGTFEGRIRILLDVIDAVRQEWPDRLPLFVRVSATDWADGGWTLDDTVKLSLRLQGTGVDLIDVSSGGLTSAQKITVAPGYQVPFARAVRDAQRIPVSAVGLITEPGQAEQTLVDGGADVVMLGRVLLREPMWPLRAAKELSAEAHWPAPYKSARYRGSIP
ncbi:NADH:flavin oxidoreductase/NADH oxidase [Rhodococcus sp. T2V]|uniref:NADH:flavin oxidoreductase/NADH oxidase n=1 Tax=Rhodococcus sp. T2V TaxID=3034164 RepID=UPI0023E0CEF5|nr:NADH:flavin oxidoreductase/NADH oxidase [Rhodococcus sp. T2V]MDF3306452.1 NADH:flavin oxidoreductase/NADH oxidase [Rhodococcus sp. T2V]